MSKEDHKYLPKKKIAKNKNFFSITSLKVKNKEQAIFLYNESFTKSKIKDFDQLFNKSSLKKKDVSADVVIAKNNEDYIYGLYVFEAKLKKSLVIKKLIIPGPIARQKIFKKFIEDIVRLGLKYKCSHILFKELSPLDWKALFLTEMGFKEVGENSWKLNL